MTSKAMYNQIANQHATADRFGSISQSHGCAIEQIRKEGLGQRNHFKVLDLGVGNGNFLKKLQRYLPHAEFTGIDISSEMLEQASKNLNLTTIQGSATEASRYLPPHSQDLVLAHFINAFIPLNTLFEQAQILTRSTGYFSLITSTYDSFPTAQQQLADFIANESLLSSIVGHYYKAALKNTTVAAGEEELLQTFSQHQFEIVDHQRLYIPIVLKNLDELTSFGIDGTWFLNNIAVRMLPKKFIHQRLKRLFSRIFTFPYKDMHILDVVLARK
ncbi:small-molecule methyltransferase IraA [Legionella adelaidensis]|uniref:Small-molecule methyltransferase IraA n=1 Tax=Legionella adelaidensis TaxID=45056 RepID=A0A0W0R4Z5_9GAMM|nr:class I SAM-dependent methyltransferase [Legionella adelaidensis]KTC66092.1 small-molecule methyltransferase IraA [Legionella adelaidensis]